MHTGRAKDGSLLYPVFPFVSYTKVTRADADSIYAYLRSIQPVRQANKPNGMPFPFNNRNTLIGWRTLFFREGEYQADPTKSVEWNRGAYLVQGLGHCSMCHTSINALGAANQNAAFAGGLIPLQNWYAPSLTSNKEAGLGDWDINDITSLLKSGVSQRGAVYGPMAEVVHNSLQYMTDDDIHSMAVYLKSLPQNVRRRKTCSSRPRSSSVRSCCPRARRSTRSSAPSATRPMVSAIRRAFPPLANNQSIQMPSAVNPIRMVLNGGYPPSTAGNPRAARHAAVRAAPVGPGSRRPSSPMCVCRGATTVRRCRRSKVNDLRSAPLD